MNKAELVDSIASHADLSKVAAAKALDALIDTVTQTLKSGESVTLVGFFTFEAHDRQARTERNPQTGAAITINAAKIPAFKAGKALKDAVN